MTTAEVRQTAIYAPAGTTTLQFDAQTVFGTNPNVAVDKNCYLELDVYYNSGTLQGYSSSNTSNGGMQGYTIDLPGLDTAQPIVIDVLVESVSLSKWDLPDGTNGNPTSYDLTSTVNVDNIRFTPEPVSMAVLAIGSLVLVRRRR